MVEYSSGARGRSEAIGSNQPISAVQPDFLTHGNPPSPARALSNLFDMIPRSVIEPRTLFGAPRHG